MSEVNEKETLERKKLYDYQAADLSKIFDVIIDLRPDSPTYMDWISFELSSQNYKMIYIPKGFAHGFQTLQDDTEIFYHMSDCYMPKNANGIAWNDKSINIKWPIENPIISDNDKSY